MTEQKFIINETETYKRDLKKLDKSIILQIEKKVDKLKENVFLGKPQKYIKNLWALHVGKYRIFYTIEEKSVVLLFIWMLTVFHKKDLDGHYPEIFEELNKLIEKIKS